jgi:uncharacterized membrane protein YphA (DoxX/SURF4 family)
MQRLACRFALIYLTLFCLATQISGSMLPNPWFSYRGLGRLPPLRDLTAWIGSAVFGITAPLDLSSSGESLFFWIQTAWIVAASIAAAIAWSLLRRTGGIPERLYPWALLFARLALAASLLEYGMTKVIPTQFPAPPLTTLVTPVGELTLSALLWTSIGAATPYQVFTGCIETLAGILLIVPRTATLGAVLGLAALVQVFALNMTYDVGLKLITLHLIALALIVLGPDVRGLSDFFLARRPGQASLPPAVVRGHRGRRAVLGAQIAFGIYLLGMLTWVNWSYWQAAGGGRPRSAFYGIWTVERMSVDGDVRDPSRNDYDRRWRRVVFDEPDRIVFQRTDDSLARYGAALDTAGGTLALTKAGSRHWRASFLIDRPSADVLDLSGEMDGRRIEARLRRVDFEAFPLLHSTFRWIRPHDAAP